MVPQMFHRIEFRRVRWQPFHSQPGVIGQHPANGLTLVHRAVVPDDDNSTTQMAQEAAQEGCRLYAGDVAVGGGLKVEAQALRPRGERDAGDGRDLLSMAAGEAENERVAAWGPAAAGGGVGKRRT